MARILIVEDDQFTRELYESLLVEAGYEVEAAADGETGFSLAMEGGFDLILLDIMLPGKDGISFLEELKKSKPKKANKKVVMLTVLDKGGFIKAAFKKGAEGYLMKSSLAPDEVLAEVRAFIDQ